MRYFFVITLLLSVGIFSESTAREVYNINREWKFFSNSEVNSDGALRVNIPHIWNTDALSGKKDYFRGIGNYLKEIEIPREWQGKRIFIKGYGANSVCNVIVNGKHIGEHRAGYTSFAYEITDYVNFGKRNFFWLIVNNSPQMDVLPIAGDQNSYGGVFRDVELIVTGRDIVSLTDQGSDGIYIAQKNVTQEIAEAVATVKLNGVRDNNVTAELTVYNDALEPVVSSSAKVKLSGRATSTVEIPFTLENPRLWDGKNDPYLYKIGIKIHTNEGISDSLLINTGFRTFSVTSDGTFLLNGKPYPIRGVVVTQDRATMGTALTPYQVKEDFDIIREIGATAVRVSGVNHHPEFYNLCDRYGIIVWNDFPLIGATYLTDKSFIDSESFRNNGMLQVSEVMRQNYNHPSIAMWGIFSNFTFRGDNPSDFIANLNMVVKREDPSRLTVASSNEDGDINFITDLIVWDHFFGWKEGLPSDIQVWSRQLHSEWKDLRSGISYSAGASIFHQEDSLYRPQYMGNWHPERWQTHLHEEYFKYLVTDSLFWGIFVGNMFDYGAAGRSWGEGNGINDSGLVTFDRKYCKDSYYLYKANWNTDTPFVYISERRWNKRRKLTQDIRVYSNRPDAELYINGISYGWEAADNGLILWPGVELQEGENFIEVKSGESYDSVIIEVLNSSSDNMII